GRKKRPVAILLGRNFDWNRIVPLIPTDRHVHASGLLEHALWMAYIDPEIEQLVIFGKNTHVPGRGHVHKFLPEQLDRLRIYISKAVLDRRTRIRGGAQAEAARIKHIAGRIVSVRFDG